LVLDSDRTTAMRKTIVLIACFIGFGAARAQAPDRAPDAASEPKTLKERLGDKASDEQRVDNCKVPASQRGAKPRPDTCAPPSR
jgi:hypothetical protein